MPHSQSITEHLSVPASYNLKRTLGLLSLGGNDPTIRLRSHSADLCFLTPEGDVTVSAQHVGESLNVQLHGDGSRWIQPHLPDCFALHDDTSTFQPDGRLRKLAADFPGIHLPRLPVVFHRLLQIVLQQLVRWEDAAATWRSMTRQFGNPAPGQRNLTMGPAPATLTKVGYYDLVACGALPRQARVILRLAADFNRIQRSADHSVERLTACLRSTRGIGPWTIQYLLGSALGDPDAVLTGDYALPHAVSWFFQRQPRGTDEVMLQLLEPYRGHRFRVQKLLMLSGISAPRRGPGIAGHRSRL